MSVLEAQGNSMSLLSDPVVSGEVRKQIFWHADIHGEEPCLSPASVAWLSDQHGFKNSHGGGGAWKESVHWGRAGGTVVGALLSFCMHEVAATLRWLSGTQPALPATEFESVKGFKLASCPGSSATWWRPHQRAPAHQRVRL